MYRKASDVARDLAVAFPQDQLLTINKGRGQFSYIPWNVVVRTLDRIFGTFGWSAEPISYTGDAATGVYLAALRLSVTVIDDETGQVITVSRPGYGRGVATPPREEAEQGIHVATNLALHDTAASAAGSDALVKATKLLGNAFGLYLYDKGAPQGQPATQGARPAAQTRTYAAGSVGPRPSVNQLPYLHKAGYDDARIATMQTTEWRAALDAFFKQGVRADGTIDPEFKRKQAARQPVTATGGGDDEDDGDDIPF